MGGIFISYRRDDSAPYARLLSEALGERFGTMSIFRDIDTISPGTNFEDAIEGAVASCDALIVVIGKSWLNITGKGGQRRLDDPADYVRLEVLAGLKRDDVLVVPVLVEDVAMPSRDELPPDLAPLAERMALELSDSGWKYQIGQLEDVLAKVITPVAQPLPEPARRRRPRGLLFGVAAGLAVVLVLVLVLVWQDDGTDTQTATGTSTTGPSPDLSRLDDPVRQQGSGYTVEVPKNWRFSDEPAVQPGTNRPEYWTDPVAPNRRLRVIGASCSSCAMTAGAADVGRLIPQAALNPHKVSSTFATYELEDGVNPFRAHGLIQVTRQGTTVTGYYRVDLWLPVELRSKATEILNSFKIS